MINLKEVYRYMGIKGSAGISAELEKRISEVSAEAESLSNFKTLSKYFEISFEDAGYIDLGFAKTRSKALRKNLEGCGKILLFAATLGMDFEKRLSFYSANSPVDALAMQAVGTELLEEKIDMFLKEKEEKEGLGFRPRFSPGYGDLELSLQREIFEALKPEKYIGVYLADSLLMIPSKTVTAICGVCGEMQKKSAKNKCAICKNKNCSYRKED